MFALTSADVRSLVGCLSAVLGEPLYQLLQFVRRGQHDHHRVARVLAAVLGVACADDGVGAVEDELIILLGDARQVADHLQRQAGRYLGDEVAPGPRGQQVVDDPGGRRRDVRLELGDRPGGERPRHDASQPGMAWIVHIDHRAEEFGELGGHVGNVRRTALPGTEHLRIPARADNVGVPDQGVVPGSPWRPRQVPLLEEGRRVQRAQPVERLLPLRQRSGPELLIRQIKVDGKHPAILRWSRGGQHHAGKSWQEHANITYRTATGRRPASCCRVWVNRGRRPRGEGMKVVIATFGSRGDVAPFIGLGVRLNDAGHDVTVAAPDVCADEIRALGLGFRAIPGDVRSLLDSEHGRQWRESSGMRAWRARMQLALSIQANVADGMVAAAQGADILLTHYLVFPHGYLVAQAMGIPCVALEIFPNLPSAEFQPAYFGARSLGRWGNRVLPRLAMRMRTPLDHGIRDFQRSLGLPVTGLPAVYRALLTTSAPRLPRVQYTPWCPGRPTGQGPAPRSSGTGWPHIRPTRTRQRSSSSSSRPVHRRSTSDSAAWAAATGNGFPRLYVRRSAGRPCGPWCRRVGPAWPWTARTCSRSGTCRTTGCFHGWLPSCAMPGRHHGAAFGAGYRWCRRRSSPTTLPPARSARTGGGRAGVPRGAMPRGSAAQPGAVDRVSDGGSRSRCGTYV